MKVYTHETVRIDGKETAGDRPRANIYTILLSVMGLATLALMSQALSLPESIFLISIMAIAVIAGMREIRKLMERLESKKEKE